MFLDTFAGGIHAAVFGIQLATRVRQGLTQFAPDLFFGRTRRTREMLDSRYDDLRHGRVKPISGDELEACFREKSAKAHRQPGS